MSRCSNPERRCKEPGQDYLIINAQGMAVAWPLCDACRDELRTRSAILAVMEATPENALVARVMIR